jgi:arginase family enzyme
MSDKTSSKFHIINVKFPQISAKNHIYNKFDYEVSDLLYDNYDDDSIPIIYNFLYKYITSLLKDKIIVTLSPDPSISGSTVSALAERYITIHNESNSPKYSSNLKILYFTSTPHIRSQYSEINVQSLSNSIVSNLLCETDFTYTKHKLVLSTNQFIMIGINPQIIDENDKDILNNKDIVYFTLDQIRKKSMSNVIRSISDLVLDDPVHVIFDMSVMNNEVAPCVTRFLDKSPTGKIDGLTISELEEALIMMNKKNIVGLDITSFDLRIKDTEKIYRLTCEVAKIVLRHLLNITERKINIFTENSKFLIWRPVDQSSHDDIGWLILRSVSLEIRERILASIDDNIITLSLTTDDDTEEDVYITSTSMLDQENKSYYTAESIYDCALTPEEKLNMMFELINTNENALLVDENALS